MLHNFIICFSAVLPSMIYLIIGIILRMCHVVDDRDVRIAVSDCLAGQVLENGTIIREIGDGGDRLRRRKSHHGRHRLESSCLKFVCGFNQVGIRELHLLAASLELQEEIVLGDEIPKSWPREAFTVLPHELWSVYAREHGGLSSGGLGKPGNVEIGINWNAVPLNQPAKSRAHLGVDRVVGGGLPNADAVNEEEDELHRPYDFISF